MVGNVGDDEAGQALVEGLRQGCVNVEGMGVAVGRKTRRVFVRRDDDGERAFVAFSGTNAEFADTVGVEEERVPGVLFYAARVLVTGTLGLAFSGSRRMVREMVEVARMCKLHVVVDVNWRPVFWEGQLGDEEARMEILRFVRGADYVKIGRDEVSFLLGEEIAGRSMEKPEEVLEVLGGSCTGVIVTDGGEGSSYAFLGGEKMVAGHVEAFPPPCGVVDTTGAGDAYLAGFLSEMLRLGGTFALRDDEKTRRIVEFAAAVAAFVVGGLGPTGPMPSREVVEEALRTAKV